MPTVQDVVDCVIHIAGRPLGREEGIQHGSDATEVSGATISWMATAPVIHAAGKAGHDLLIAHESLYYPYEVINSEYPPPGWQDWSVNRHRRALLNRYDLAFARLHGTVDHLCICDAFASVLKLGEPLEKDGLVRVYGAEGCTLRELVSRVKGRLEIPAVRVARMHRWDEPLHRIGLPVGGLGLFVNVGHVQKLVELNCDAMIAGESDDYGFRFALESGASMIETSHELSENPGLEHFRDILAGEFPGVEFSFFRNRCPWEII